MVVVVLPVAIDYVGGWVYVGVYVEQLMDALSGAVFALVQCLELSCTRLANSAFCLLSQQTSYAMQTDGFPPVTGGAVICFFVTVSWFLLRGVTMVLFCLVETRLPAQEASTCVQYVP